MKQIKQDHHYKLNNGVSIPAVGFGTWQTPDGCMAVSAVKTALCGGYSHIDTAAVYGNEESVGRGVRESLADRSDLFVTGKLWNTERGYDKTIAAFEKTLQDLDTDYLDLYLIHWPASPRQYSNWREINSETWRALETLYDQGKIRAIGVSNFGVSHLEALLEDCRIRPMVNQIEVHPYFQQKELQSLHAKHHILTQAWSPIGGITSYRGGGKSTFDDPTLQQIAREHGKSPAQVMLRWHLQQGRSAIPKSTRAARIAENFDVFGFELTEQQLAAIDALDTGVRGGPEPDDITLENYGRDIPEA